jgi:hypothetical protein
VARGERYLSHLNLRAEPGNTGTQEFKRKIVPMAENSCPQERNLHLAAVLPLAATTFGITRAAARTIRFWTFPCNGSSREVMSLARQLPAW